jgi:glucokinase
MDLNGSEWMMSDSQERDANEGRAEILNRQSCFLGVDVGGTKLASGVITHNGQVLCYFAQPTPKKAGAEELFQAIVDLAIHARRNFSGTLTALGIGCGGPMIFPAGIVSPLHLPVWQTFPLRARLAEALSLPARLDNDAKAFALGESMFGAGRGSSCMMGIVVSTGVGGGVVINGRLLHGATGNAGHIGHITVSRSGPRCSCGAMGCVSAYASGTGLVRRAKSGIRGGVQTSLTFLSNDELSGKAIALAASSGDTFALKLMEDAGTALASGIVNVANLLDLDCVVLGGGIVQSGEMLFSPLLREYQSRAKLQFTRNVEIRTAALGYEAGVVGAAALCLQ